MTHMCCDTTARQAVHRGLTVEFLRDATGTLDLSNEAGDVIVYASLPATKKWLTDNKWQMAQPFAI